MYLFDVTMTDATGNDLHIRVAANEGFQAIERAERQANRRARHFEAWRIVRVATVH